MPSIEKEAQLRSLLSKMFKKAKQNDITLLQKAIMECKKFGFLNCCSEKQFKTSFSVLDRDQEFLHYLAQGLTKTTTTIEKFRGIKRKIKPSSVTSLMLLESNRLKALREEMASHSKSARVSSDDEDKNNRLCVILDAFINGESNRSGSDSDVPEEKETKTEQEHELIVGVKEQPEQQDFWDTFGAWDFINISKPQNAEPSQIPSSTPIMVPKGFIGNHTGGYDHITPNQPLREEELLEERTLQPHRIICQSTSKESLEGESLAVVGKETTKLDPQLLQILTVMQDSINALSANVKEIEKKVGNIDARVKKIEKKVENIDTTNKNIGTLYEGLVLSMLQREFPNTTVKSSIVLTFDSKKLDENDVTTWRKGLKNKKDMGNDCNYLTLDTKYVECNFVVHKNDGSFEILESSMSSFVGDLDLFKKLLQLARQICAFNQSSHRGKLCAIGLICTTDLQIDKVKRIVKEKMKEFPMLRSVNYFIKENSFKIIRFLHRPEI